MRKQQGSGVKNQESGSGGKMTKLILLSLAALLLTGCASTQEARLYILNSTNFPTEDLLETAGETPAINITSVQISDTLSRPAIITQVAENELAVSDFHRWAGPLQNNIRQVLVENLSSLLQSDRIFSDPRKQTFRADYHLEIRSCNLTGVLGETAILKARWAVLSPGGEEIVALKNFQKTINIDGKSHRDYVNAQSQLLADFSRKIADSIPIK